MTQVADIWDVVEPYLAAERLELDDLELAGRDQGRILRVTVDGEGVTVDRLASLARGLSRLLDNETELEGQYQLEVSSPGLERKLRRPSHYQKSVGRELVAQVSLGETKTTIRGILADANEDSFTIEADDGLNVVSYEDVITAKTVFRWEKAPKPGH
ncbi:MAG: ribosome maturation factor RimP [Acidimicrobiia bacterium]